MSEKNMHRPLRSALAIGLLLTLAGTSVGCQSMWDRVRERERMFALDVARIIPVAMLHRRPRARD